ncbi:MAG: PRC-barrel domain-containing protein [Candidatus Magasanikbacteria bacterium]|nr:PRC-barrel domain-containing protein [Candidatus Magasanikbacteria bacterium]
MIINLRKLLDLPVYTESGAKLGKIFDFELDIENHFVLRYLVRPNFISLQNFLIQSAQVQKITNDRMIVDDAVVKAKKTAPTIVSEE